MKNIWTNGCFDILHIGHIKLFEYAKGLGDRLIVGIDSDQRVRSLKGEKRPINNAMNRCGLLESIKYIDKVYIFNNDDELKSLITRNNIDIIVVGDDYKNKPVIGQELVNSVIFFPKLVSQSTSRIIYEL